MSFFDHHYCQPGYDRFATYPAFYHRAPPVNTSVTPYPSFATQPDYYSIEEEERAALAHLQTIQRRRQAMEAAQAREAAIHFHAQARREAAIRAEVARQVAREQALHARRVEEERRKRAYLKLIEKREAKARALKEAQYLHELQAQRERAIGCSKRCCRTVTPDQPPGTPVFDEMNAIFGALLGIPVKDSDGDSDVKSCCKSQPASVACSSQPKIESKSRPKTQPKPEFKPEPKPEIKSKPTSASTTKSATASASSSEEASLDLNKLLNQFLGLQIEPLPSNVPTSASKPSKIPEGLNEFLAQFGLVFEPEEHIAERSCEGTSNDTCTDNCQYNGSDSCQGFCKKKKGKQVAEGEKKPAPASTTGNAPTTAAADNAVAAPDPSTSISALQDIEHHEEVLVNQHAAGPTARVVSAFDESTAATPALPQSSESFASVVEEALQTPANTSEEIPSTPVVEQAQEGSSDNLAATAQSQSPGPQPTDVSGSTPISPVHRPVTVEDAEDEDNKKERNRKEKQQAKDEGYEMI
ncbi:uncharacterized protein IAS62_004920 [Cryptococcus decagattii]|uniref:Uncharacterized protein n=1 Tax=Cryptococcus decagattii TaxID=1859122 RepID=A0ABZ2B4A4_9TREE